MIKQIKPHSLSHKFLSLIFEKHEIRRGINICDVPWRALKSLLLFIVIATSLLFLGGGVVAWVVGFILTLLAPVVDYNLFFACWAGWGLAMTFGALVLAGIMSPIIYFSEDLPIIPTYLKKDSSDKQPSPPSLISIWWKSFKEKTCVKIVVGEEK